jgi:hypothetical protein
MDNKLDSRLILVPTNQLNEAIAGPLEGLAASIKATGGLVRPVLVDIHGNILDGRRRMAASQADTVLGIRLNLEGTEAEMEAARIELLQKKTSPLHRAGVLGRYKELYDHKHPEQTKGGNQKLKKAKKEQSLIVTFCKMIAQETDSSVSSIEKLIQVSTIPADVRTEIAKNEDLCFRLDRLLQMSWCEKKDGIPAIELKNLYDANPNWAYYDCVNEYEKQQNIKAGKPWLVPNSGPDYKIIEGDFNVVLPQMIAAGTLPDIRATITDPPYLEPNLYLLPAFAQLCAQVLPKSGVAAVMFGHAYLNRAIRELDKFLYYRWIIADDYGKTGQTMHSVNMSNHWKPILIYAKHTQKLATFGPDIIRGNGFTDDFYDDWQQLLETFEQLVLRLTKPGDWILEPFLGTGTTMIAALKHGRRCIGIDIDPNKIEMTKTRIQKELGIAG